MQEKQRIQLSGKVVSILKEQSMRRKIAGRHGWNGIHHMPNLPEHSLFFLYSSLPLKSAKNPRL